MILRGAARTTLFKKVGGKIYYIRRSIEPTDQMDWSKGWTCLQRRYREDWRPASFPAHLDPRNAGIVIATKWLYGEDINVIEP